MATNEKDTPKVQIVRAKNPQNIDITAAPDVNLVKKVLRFDGKLITSVDPSLIGENFSALTNMIYNPTGKGIKSIAGQTVINSTPLKYDQNYTAFTETDVAANVVAITDSDTITVSNLDNDENVYITRDFGDDYFSSDFVFRFKYRATAYNSVGLWLWAVSDSADNLFDSDHSLVLGISSGGLLTLVESYLTPYSSGQSDQLDLATDYYIQITRSQSAGDTILQATVYTDAAYSTEMAGTATISLTLHAEESYRYLYAVAAAGAGGGGVGPLNATIENLTILTGNGIEAGFHLKKSSPSAESIIIVQADISGRTELFQNTTAIPSAGNFSTTPIFHDSEGALAGRFTKAPDDQVAYCNSLDTCLWSGAEHPPSAFVTSTAAITNTATNPRDYTKRVQNNSQAADQVAIIGGGAGSDCVLLCHMDTSGFVDVKSHAVVVTGAVASTTYIKFGVASGYFDWSNDYITYADSDDWAMGTGKVTIDFWVKFHALPGSLDEMGFFQQRVDADNYMMMSLYNNGSTYQPYFKIKDTAGGTGTLLVGKGLELGLTSAQLLDGQFHHFALTRGVGGANNWDIWVDGVSQAGTTAAYTWPNFAADLDFGRIVNEAGTGKYLGAYADELRILKGTAYWSGPFTPMDRPYPDNTANYFAIGSTRKLNGVKFYLSKLNTVTGATLTVQESVGSSWQTLTSTDSTTGLSVNEVSITWPSTVNTSELRYLEGRLLYFYQFALSAGAAEIYKVTVDAEMQQIIDTWDGIERPIASAVKYVVASTSYSDFTFNVRDNRYVAIDSTNFDPSTFYQIGNLVAGDSLIFGFTEPMIGLVFAFIESSVNTTASTDMTVRRCAGLAAIASWEAVTNLSDGTIATVSFGKNGTVTWSPIGLASESKVSLNNGHSLYQYAVQFDAALDADTKLYYVAGIPAPNNPVNYNFPVHTLNRLFLCKDNKARYSAFDTASIFNGSDSGEIEFGDGAPLTCAASLYSQFGSDLKSVSLFFKDTQTWSLVGSDPLTWEKHPISLGVGCPAPLTLKLINLPLETAPGLNRHVAIWQGANGIYISDGQSPIPIHGDIADIFDPRSTSTCISRSAIGNSIGFVDQNELTYHYLYTENATGTIKEKVFSFRKWAWSNVDRSVAANALSGAIEVEDVNGNQYVYGIVPNGYLHRLEYGNSFNGTAITSTIGFGSQILASNPNDIFTNTRLRMANLIQVAKNTTTNTVTLTDRVDTATSGTNYTFDPTDATHRLSDVLAEANSTPGIFHDFTLSLVTSDENIGFQPIALGIWAEEVREKT